MAMLALVPTTAPHIYVSAITTSTTRTSITEILKLLLLPNFLFSFLGDCNAATACYGNSSSQFPSSNLFAAAGEGIWDNGAACGRQYLVRCISAAVPRTCLPDQMVQVRIVDRAQTSRSGPSSDGVTIVLATPAFGTIADPSAPSINVEFQQ